MSKRLDFASAVRRVLSERIMLLLSLATLPGATLQLLTQIDQPEALVIDVIDWTVVLLFAVDYSAGLKLAGAKLRYVKERWNTLNLFIIALAVMGFATASPLLYSAPLLRIARTTRFFSESGRSSLELSR